MILMLTSTCILLLPEHDPFVDPNLNASLALTDLLPVDLPHELLPEDVQVVCQ